MFVLPVEFSLKRWKTTLEEKLAFAASLNHGEKCLKIYKWYSRRESKHRHIDVIS